MEHNYVCIHCGKQAPALYREYTKELLKMCHCENCKMIVDGYVETEASIILIDAVLQRKRAYRHILFNAEIKFVWKLAIVFLLCDAYQKWILDRAVPWNFDNSDGFIYLELEWNFYFACLKATIENLLFLFFVVLFIFIIYKKRISKKKNSTTNLLNGLVIFSYGKVFYLPAVLWGMHGGTTTDFLITAFVLISEIQACIVTVEIPKVFATAIVVFSYVLHRAVALAVYKNIHN
ncbi:protein ARV1 [Centruroides vittatus]|uniref:protein ARV1 n=1 Tax=Centruroides vittatus TaxID=120091 RepID=UPI00350EFFF4